MIPPIPKSYLKDFALFPLSYFKVLLVGYEHKGGIPMDTQYSFQRYEKKFWLTPSQKQALLDLVSQHIQPDAYPHYTICNIYYDTPDFRLIRASLEKPDYKEKLRCRSYGVPGRNAPVFLELKKKCCGIVYKRRITVPADRVELALNGISVQGQQTQIANEIAWFQQVNRTEPSVFLAYDREAYSGIQDPEVRITFDTQLRYRTTEQDLRLGDAGMAMFEDDRILMELKLPGVCPLWLSQALSQIGAFPTSFSKYGYCYTKTLLPGAIRKFHQEARHYA